MKALPLNIRVDQAQNEEDTSKIIRETGSFRGRIARALEPRPVKCMFCGSGLVLSFLVYGVLQEILMTQPFPAVSGDGEAEHFTNSEFLVASNRVVAILAALVALLCNGESLSPTARPINYFTIAFANTIGAFCQYEALKYVIFPAQTVAKCAKMLPVLLAGTLLKTRSYSLWDWINSSLIGIGCSVFILTGVPHDAPEDYGVDVSSTFAETLTGCLLLLAFLFTDGFTSSLQERLFQKDEKGSTYNQMLYNNAASLTICLLSLVSRNQIVPSIHFCLEHPSFLRASLLLSIAAAIGQMFIYYTIKELGALFYSVSMVTRQLISIILSCILFLHPLSFTQIISGIFVFILLYVQSLEKKK